VAAKPRNPPREEATVAVLPGPAKARQFELARLLPSGRSVVVAIVIAALGAGAYLLARESSLFAVQRIEVVGAPSSVAARVRGALAPFDGASLVTLDGPAVQRRLAELPVVASARYDRDFPHTLRVFIRPERPVAVLRRGAESWLLSARGRVMARIDRGAERHLPRIWAKRTVSVSLGATLSGDAARGVEAVTPFAGTAFARRVATVRTDGELTVVLRSGLELRLGDTQDLPVKLAVAERIANVLGNVVGYVDLSVPGRPVSSTNPKVAG
jgi:cell division protein FtsQ